MPWVEFKVGTNRLVHMIRTESIVKVFAHEGEYGPATGICVAGQDMPTWVKKPVREVISMIERAEKKAAWGAPEPAPERPGPDTGDIDDDLDRSDDIPF